MKRYFLVIVGLFILAGAGLSFGLQGVVSAQSSNTSVSAKTAKHPRRIRLHAKLNQAARDGTITASQKAALLNELKTLRTERKSAINKSSTTAERQAERTKLQTELQSWATSNSFPLNKIFPKLAS